MEGGKESEENSGGKTEDVPVEETQMELREIRKENGSQFGTRGRNFGWTEVKGEAEGSQWREK